MARIADAWAWLQAHALVGPHAMNTLSEWQQVTELGREIADDPSAVTKVWAADRLAGNLDPLLSSAQPDLGEAIRRSLLRRFPNTSLLAFVRVAP
jgi:hypothetical protein